MSETQTKRTTQPKLRHPHVACNRSCGIDTSHTTEAASPPRRTQPKLRHSRIQHPLLRRPTCIQRACGFCVQQFYNKTRRRKKDRRKLYKHNSCTQHKHTHTHTHTQTRTHTHTHTECIAAVRSDTYVLVAPSRELLVAPNWKLPHSSLLENCS